MTELADDEVTPEPTPVAVPPYEEAPSSTGVVVGDEPDGQAADSGVASGEGG